MRILLRYAGIAIAAGVVLSGCIYASESFERFLIRDPRFFLPGPADYGLESPNLELHGVKYASRQQILRLFESDYGRSLYLFPLATRRKTLLGVRWVHDASIARIWPDRVIVQIIERKPAAFVKLPAESMVRWGLIDDEGVILDPPAKASFQLPVLAGVMGGESQEKRGIRVRRMQRLMKQLGPLGDNVSEIDATDLDDLRITEQAGGGAVSLMLGDRNFSTRLRNFLNHYPDIHRKMPQATSFDLRLDDRITGLEASRDAR
jgi:cell division protein FtsQ